MRSRSLKRCRKAHDKEALQRAAEYTCRRHKASLITQAGAATHRYGGVASTLNKLEVPDYGTQINYKLAGGTK